jgi:putative flippase GtrA
MLFVLLLMAQFQFWDGLMTQVFVSRGLVKEANPLMAPLVSGGSFLPLKLLGIAVLLLLLWILYKRFPKMAVVAASTISVFSAVLIIWNFMVFFRPS